MSQHLPVEPLSEEDLEVARWKAEEILRRLNRQLWGGRANQIGESFEELLYWASRVPSTDVRRWSQQMEAEALRVMQGLPPKKGWEKPEVESRRGAWMVLLAHLFHLPMGNAEKAERLYRTIQQGMPCYCSTWVYKLIAKGPDTPPKLLREIAAERSVGAHRGLASSPRAVGIRGIGQQLRSSSDVMVHYYMTEHVRGEAFRHSFAKIAEWATYDRDDDDAGRVDEMVDYALERLEAPGAADLKPIDLLPLLQSDRSEVRLAAVRAQSQIALAPKERQQPRKR